MLVKVLFDGVRYGVVGFPGEYVGGAGGRGDRVGEGDLIFLVIGEGLGKGVLRVLVSGVVL